jgi:hypothetical protein
MGYSREGDVVTVRMTVETFNGLLMCLGTAAASELCDLSLRTANAINDGNPDWRPYAVPEEART